jgi:predicted RNA binding protein YcfA (HicA-like mRNA interferase family)
MGKLPVLSGRKVVRVFQRAGWYEDRQEGSHVILKKEGKFCNLSIPVHSGKNVKRGLLRKQIARAEMTVDEFLELLS